MVEFQALGGHCQKDWGEFPQGSTKNRKPLPDLVGSPEEQEPEEKGMEESFCSIFFLLEHFHLLPVGD